MTICSKIIWDGKPYELRYTDTDSFSNLPKEKCRQIYGVCFYNNKLVIGFNGKKRTWSLIGGTVEQGETLEQTLIREILEESNMKVLKAIPIGYQIVVGPDGVETLYQLRSCCIVEPIGPFVSDPDGSVTEIKLIDPLNYKKYFDWGEIGDCIINRAIKLRENILKKIQYSY